MTSSRWLFVALVLASAQLVRPLPQSESRLGEWSGRVETGMMAIGGESTGVRITAGQERFEVAAEGDIASRIRNLNGQAITIRGRLTVRPGVEIGTRRIITVIELRQPPPVARRAGGDVMFTALSGRPTMPRVQEKITALSPSLRAEFDRRVQRVRGHVPKAQALPSGVDRISDDMAQGHLSLEAQLVGFAGPTTAAEAASYAAKATLFYEWEGDPEGPLQEAAYAATYVSQHPTSPLRDYLELFQLYRLRAAFEAAGAATAPWATPDVPAARFAAAERDASEKYRAVWARVSNSTDPLVKAIAADIDTETWIYIDIAAHPRATGTTSRRAADRVAGWLTPSSLEP